jgi:signal transduction histidine kinase
MRPSTLVHLVEAAWEGFVCSARISVARRDAVITMTLQSRPIVRCVTRRRAHPSPGRSAARSPSALGGIRISENGAAICAQFSLQPIDCAKHLGSLVRHAMRLSQFILENLERILQAWEDFARSLPPGHGMTVSALRDDAERMLRFIAHDMETGQSPNEQFLKSIGAGPQPERDDPSAAQDHGVSRAVDRFSLSEMVSEYRALRASVLSLWLQSPERDASMEQIVRFNEAVDQIVAESVSRFSSKLDSDADVFTASIGHDLRNPLNAIAVSAQVLHISANLSDDERKAVDQILQSATRMSNMLRELQDFSRVRLSAVLPVQRQPLDVARLCADVVQEITAARPDIHTTLTQTGDTVASINGERVAQLVSNLVANAAEYGVRDRNVIVRVSGHDRFVAIDVHNRGPAIPPEAIDHIFDPLYRGERTSAAPRAHLGLGLYIARMVALSHGGDIDVTSTDREGTTFRVRFPRS